MAVKCKECGRKYVSDDFLQTHIKSAHPAATGAPKSKGWATPFGFIDFTKPVTYEEACIEIKMISSMLERNGKKHYHLKAGAGQFELKQLRPIIDWQHGGKIIGYK